jgi:hypothetical protein
MHLAAAQWELLPNLGLGFQLFPSSAKKQVKEFVAQPSIAAHLLQALLKVGLAVDLRALSLPRVAVAARVLATMLLG